MFQLIEHRHQREALLLDVAFIVVKFHAIEQHHPFQIGLHGHQPRPERVGRVVFGGKQQGRRGRSHRGLRGFVGPGATTGHAGRDVERDETLAQARITRQQRQLAASDPLMPEPIHILGGHVGEPLENGAIARDGHALRGLLQLPVDFLDRGEAVEGEIKQGLFDIFQESTTPEGVVEIEQVAM